MKRIFCKLLGHTWIHRSENPKIAWSTAKNLSELEQRVEGEPRFWLECCRCGVVKNDPTPEDLKRAS